MCMPRRTNNEARVPFAKAVARKLRVAGLRERERTLNVIGRGSENVLLD
jgi:hypothetical protein